MTAADDVSKELGRNEARLRAILGDSYDLVFRPLLSGQMGGRQGLLVYIEGLSDTDRVQELLTAALQLTNPPYVHPEAATDPLVDLQRSVVHLPSVKLSQSLQAAAEVVLTGQCALLLDGSAHLLLADTRANPGRTVEEPKAEAEVRGPRDGMVESLQTNTALVRRRIKDPKLRFERLTVGTRTKTDVILAYIEGLADPDVVREVRSRINRIEIDRVAYSASIDELIQDNPYSPFGPLLSTERPDKLASALLEGRVGILVDNTPFALIAPTTFWMMLQAPGDYIHGWYAGTAFRWIRFLSLALALTLSSMYTMLTTFHHEMIPTPLALSLAGGREGTPLPTVLEVLLMEVMFEVIQEAGLRLPRAVGQTVSIVGALVIGDAAVRAGLVAPGTIIVIATAGLTGFALPNYATSLAIRLVRFPLLLLSGTLGVFGFLAGTSFLALHLTSLRSFGAPYMGPLLPLRPPQLAADTLFRAPIWTMLKRPKTGSGPTGRRMPPGQKPEPPAPGSSR